MLHLSLVIKMYVAKPAMFGTSWNIETQYSCINGLSAWFVICTIDEPSDAEIGYTDGAILSVKERAEWIVKVLNNYGQEYS